MMKYDFVFVVLVYRNTQDLKDFFSSLLLSAVKVIVVNSFYDEESECEFKNIAEANNADFLSVPNKGYGTGNNRGVDYALTHYDFKYLVISNADICIEKMDLSAFFGFKEGIYAPSIHTLSGKQQNPHMPFHISLIDSIKYKCFMKNDWKPIMFFCALNKIFRIFFLSFFRYIVGNRIYSAHGAFVVLPKQIIEKLVPLYDENVFLFTEEENLAMNARFHGVATFFVPNIKIRHKEDGSTSTLGNKQKDITRKSFITFYKKWYL